MLGLKSASMSVLKMNRKFQVSNRCFCLKLQRREVKVVISNLDNKSSSAEDFVNNHLVKMSAPVTIEYITFLINLSFHRGEFPQELKKKTKLFPLHKSGSKLEENNYRPISLLIVWSKVYGKIMFNRVYSYFERFSLFYHRQFGFQNKHYNWCTCWIYGKFVICL